MDIIREWDSAALNWSHRENILLRLRNRKSCLLMIFPSRHLREMFLIRLFEYYLIHQNEFINLPQKNILVEAICCWSRIDRHLLGSLIHQHNYHSLFMNEKLQLHDQKYLLEILVEMQSCFAWTQIALTFQKLNYNQFVFRLLLRFPNEIDRYLLLVLTNVYSPQYEVLFEFSRDLLVSDKLCLHSFGLDLLLYLITHPLIPKNSVVAILQRAPNDLLDCVLRFIITSHHSLHCKVC